MNELKTRINCYTNFSSTCGAQHCFCKTNVARIVSSALYERVFVFLFFKTERVLSSYTFATLLSKTRVRPAKNPKYIKKKKLSNNCARRRIAAAAVAYDDDVTGSPAIPDRLLRRRTPAESRGNTRETNRG